MTEKHALIGAILLLAARAFGAELSAMEQGDLNKILASQPTVSWSCTVNGNASAVQLLTNIHGDASALRSSSNVLVVNSSEVADALGFRTYPVVMAASGSDYDIRGTEGYNEPTAEFLSASDGMEIVAIANGSSPSVDWNRNWFFPNGTCTKY